MLSLAAVGRNRSRPDIQYNTRSKQHKPDAECELFVFQHNPVVEHDPIFEQQLGYESIEFAREFQPVHSDAFEHRAERDQRPDLDHARR